MLKIIVSNQFRKDLKTASKRGLKTEKLTEVINILASEMPLDAGFHDHSLTGQYKSFRECHVEPDWLLIYRKKEITLELFLFRTGTHSDLL